MGSVTAVSPLLLVDTTPHCKIKPLGNLWYPGVCSDAPNSAEDGRAAVPLSAYHPPAELETSTTVSPTFIVKP